MNSTMLSSDEGMLIGASSTRAALTVSSKSCTHKWGSWRFLQRSRRYCCRIKKSFVDVSWGCEQFHMMKCMEGPELDLFMCLGSPTFHIQAGRQSHVLPLDARKGEFLIIYQMVLGQDVVGRRCRDGVPLVVFAIIPCGKLHGCCMLNLTGIFCRNIVVFTR